MEASPSPLPAVDYGYEEHMPMPRSNNGYDDLEVPHIEYPCHSQFNANSVSRRGSSMGSPFTGGEDDDNEPGAIDATEVSQSPSHHGCPTVTFDALLFKESEHDYPPMPAERQARKNRSFSRRGGAVHSSLLKSAVMASMMDFDSGDDEIGSSGPRRNPNALRHDSSISLQSLQDALLTETSPRKRARRRVVLNKSSEDSEDDDDEDSTKDITKGAKSNVSRSDDVNEASHLFDTMRMGGNALAPVRKAPIRKESFKREPPPRRVSRKTSYDSRVSDFDSDCGSDWEH